ncbi:MAG: FG-GAP-like repeat-containing protein [Gaiellales bacterium]
MSAPALPAFDGPTLRIGGTSYPVLLPRVTDPRLHLAAVIISLHVLGQVAFEFELSIAQILISLGTAGLLELVITFFQRRVIMWPASALLTGNGVAFILRAGGTEHGDWWSLHAWWLFSGTAALALLSKHVIRVRGRHIFNPSNFGLLLCFLAFGPERAEPLDFWWGPMSTWMALALGIIVCGGLAILLRIGLFQIALTFWATFAVAIAVLAASGHAMTARWHLGPITGLELWRVIVFSPEVLIFLFFMITDPKTIPSGGIGRRWYAGAIALLATLLITPFASEFDSKVALLASLTVVCAAWPVVGWLVPRLAERRLAAVGRSLAGRGAVALVTSGGALALVAAIGSATPAGVAAAGSAGSPASLPRITIARSNDVAGELDPATARKLTRDLVSDLDGARRALWERDEERAATVASGTWLASLLARIQTPTSVVQLLPTYRARTVTLHLEAGAGQGPPTAVAELGGTVRLQSFRGSPPKARDHARTETFRQTFELAEQHGRWVIARSRSATPPLLALAGPNAAPVPVRAGAGGVKLTDVARARGLVFEHGVFNWKASADPPAMMGGGVCWLDADGDGWLDLYAVNSHADLEIWRWDQQGGLPRNALFRNDHRRFVDVSHGSGADLQVRGNGCAAADLNGDGHTDLYVSAVGTDAILWNDGDGTFTEGAADAGVTSWGWHAGVTVGDANGDNRPDVFVAGYTNMSASITGSSAGFPTDHEGVADALYLNLGNDDHGRARFRDVARLVGIDRMVEHGLGASFTDVDGDRRLDLVVANDEDPNRVYLNRADPGELGFRFVERASALGADDGNAGMGISRVDYDSDGHRDLIVTNARRQLHAVYRATGSRFADSRPDFATAFDTKLTGWGVAWTDLDRDGTPELVIANGGIPVLSVRRDAQRLLVLRRLGDGRYGDASRSLGLRPGPVVNGRGLAEADFDNDGAPDFALGSIGGPLSLLRSSGAKGHWLTVAPSPVQAGTTVTIELADGRRFVREVALGSSYLSSEDPRPSFGLGGATRVTRVTVRFQDGAIRELRDVAVDRIVAVTR